MLKRMRAIGILILVCVVTCFGAYSTGLANDGKNRVSDEFTAHVVDFPLSMNGEEIAINNPVVAIDNRTYIPLDEFCHAFDMDMNWIETEGKFEMFTSMWNWPDRGLTLKDFEFLKLDMDMQTVYDTVGEPSYTDSEDMSRIYQLADGNELLLNDRMTNQLKTVVLETGDGARILIANDETSAGSSPIFENAQEVVTVEYTPIEMSPKEFVGKLRLGMHVDEVYEAVGYPNTTNPYGVFILEYALYHAGTHTTIRLLFMGPGEELAWVVNNDGIDLLSDEFTAHAVDVPLIVDEKEIEINDPVVTIADQIYIPLRAFCDALGIDVNWIEAERKIELSTNMWNWSDKGLTLKDFEFITQDMNMQTIYDKVDEPDYYTGSGLMWGVYQLADGNKLHLNDHMRTQLKVVTLETRDGTEIHIPFDEEGSLMID